MTKRPSTALGMVVTARPPQRQQAPTAPQEPATVATGPNAAHGMLWQRGAPLLTPSGPSIEHLKRVQSVAGNQAVGAALRDGGIRSPPTPETKPRDQQAEQRKTDAKIGAPAAAGDTGDAPAAPQEPAAIATGPNAAHGMLWQRGAPLLTPSRPSIGHLTRAQSVAGKQAGGAALHGSGIKSPPPPGTKPSDKQGEQRKTGTGAKIGATATASGTGQTPAAAGQPAPVGKAAATRAGATPISVAAGTQPGAASTADAASATAGGAVPIHRKLVAVMPSAAGGGATTPAAVKAQVQQVAANLPHPALAGVGKPAVTHRRAPGADQATAAAHATAGPAPLPTGAPTEPDDSPIPEAMKKIADAAGQRLPDIGLPPVKMSPGHHVPDLERPITKDMQRKLLLADAHVDNKLFGGASEQERRFIAEVHDSFSKLPKPSDGPAPPVIAVIPPPIKIQQNPLPPLAMPPLPADLSAAIAGYLTSHQDVESEQIAREIIAGLPQGGATIQQIFPEIDKEIAPQVRPVLKAAVEPLAAVLGVVAKPFDAAVTERQTEVISSHGEATAARLDVMNFARKDAHNAAQDRANQAVAAARAVAVSANEKAKGAKTPPKPDLKARVESAMARIQDKVGEAIAAYQMMLRTQLAAVDAARERQACAYRRAALQDRFDLEDENDVHQPNERKILTGQSQEWAEQEIRSLGEEVERLKQKETAEVQGGADKARDKSLIGQVETAGTGAITDLKASAAAQGAGKEAWWQEVSATLDAWAKAAAGNANSWAQVEAHAAKRLLQQDYAAIKEFEETTAGMKNEEIAQYIAALDGHRQMLVNAFAEAPKGTPPMLNAFVLDLRLHIAAENRERLKDAVMDAVAAKVSDAKLDEIAAVATAVNPGFKAGDTVAKIKEALGKGSDGRDALSGALSGLSKLELAVVKRSYALQTADRSLDADIKKEFEITAVDKKDMKPEQQRALALLAGDQNAADSATIKAALDAWFTKKKPIMEVLRSLDEKGIKALRERYKAEYKIELDDALKKELKDSDLAQANALLAGDRTAADAFALDVAIREEFTSSRDGVAAVYDQIRAEATARGQRERWTSSQVEAEISRRNELVRQAFNKQFAGVEEYKGLSKTSAPLDVAFRHGFTSIEHDLNKAIADNDPVAADAARLQLEHQGTYADDDTLNNIFRSQFERALAAKRLDEGPELDEAVNRKISEEIAARSKSGKQMSGEEIANLRMKYEHEKETAIAHDAKREAKKSMGALSAYSIATYHTSLTYMINHDMSGLAQDEAKKRFQTGGELDAYDRINFAISSTFTNKEELRGALNSMSKEERDAANERWMKEHNGQTLEQAVADNTHGREQNELTYLAKNGAPMTVEAQVNELKNKLEGDRKSNSFIGRSVSKDEMAWAETQVKQLEDAQKELKRTDLSPDQRARSTALYETHRDFATAAIQSERAAVDRVSEKATEVFQKAVTALVLIAGTLAAVFTGGASLALAIAIAGSLLGTLGAMAIKRAVRGGAYGADEVATDAAVGAIDLAVTILTAGAGKGAGSSGARAGMANVRAGLKGAAKEALKKLSKEALRNAREAGLKALIGGLTNEGKAVAKGEIAHAAARMAGRGLLKAGKVIGHEVVDAGKAFATNFVQGIPTTLARNMLQGENWHRGNAFGGIVSETLSGAYEGAKDGMAWHFAGRALHGTLGGLHKPTEGSHALRRAEEFAEWQRENPPKKGQTPAERHAEFSRQMDAKAAQESANAAKAHDDLRQARRELLSELSPKERAAIADVPIAIVKPEEFIALGGGKGGDSLVHTHNGQVTVFLREGAPPSALREYGPALKEKVEAGTGGRTKNPAEALPSRLRNRVVVEHLPLAAGNEVRVVPERAKDGSFIGVKLKVGPHATAADIRGHVAIIDAMRKYAGLLGRARLAVDAVHMRINPEIVTPLKPGHYEAALELRKLPAIIEEHMTRLADAGADLRARAQIEADIRELNRQFLENHERFSRCVLAEEKGYVAMESTRKKKTGRSGKEETEPATKDKPAKKTAAEAAAEHAKTKSALANSAAAEIDRPHPAEPPTEAEKAAKAKELMDLYATSRELTSQLAEATALHESRGAAEETYKQKELLSAERELSALLKNLANVPKYAEVRDAFLDIAKNTGELAEHRKAGGAFQELYEELARDAPTSNLMMRLKAFELAEQTLEKYGQLSEQDKTAIAEFKRRIEAIKRQFKASGGRVESGIALNTKLPKPFAEGYDPIELKKGKSPAERLKHRNGRQAELRLANDIADMPGENVLKYGDIVVFHGSDVISVNSEGEREGAVTLWDSKYHTEKTSPFVSKTFTEESTRNNAIEEAYNVITMDTKLPEAVRLRASDNVNPESIDKRNYTMVTTHTHGIGIVSYVVIEVRGSTVGEPRIVSHWP